MSRQCMLRREEKRTELRKKYEAKRDELTQIVKNRTASYEEKISAMKKLQSLPRDSSSTRRRSRCWQTGRGNGVYRIVGLCRNKFRELCMNGYIPGMRKASW